METTNNGLKLEVEGGLIEGSGSPVDSPIGLAHFGSNTLLLNLVAGIRIK